MMKKILLLLALLLPPEGETLKIAPWNGYKGAVSFTFDDGDPSHQSVAIPELDKRKIHGTFFLIVKSMGRGRPLEGGRGDRPRRSQATPRRTRTRRSSSPTRRRPRSRARRKRWRRRSATRWSRSAYPFSAITPAAQGEDRKDPPDRARRCTGNVILARPGTRLAQPRQPSDAHRDEGRRTIRAGSTRAQAKGAWSIFMIHGLEGTNWG